GEILIRGRAVQNVPPFHRPVNTVFQDYALFPHMTVQKNVMFGLEMEGVPRAEAERRAEEALHLVRLPDIGARKPRQLSGGQQQRVALARALVKQPAVLLLDEPGVGVDPVSRQDLWRMVQALTDEGMAVVWSTAYLDEAERCESVLLLNQGQLLFDGPPQQLTAQLEG
ncbi:ATP-binding cassette domain-containing protein, partial [Elstera cyanobacteriorum]|uniref:ATP-binding cassette domain-containing protein n=1 Tax=Elstera cyanobacteriorum TaxID=2022747 RepID=UPI0023F35D5C